jgi:TRAP-type C4-dicarboxylate transport system substrate-binding protein
MKLWRIVVLSLCLLLGAGFFAFAGGSGEAGAAAPPAGDAAVKITVAHMFPEKDPYHLGILDAEKYLKEKTNGRITFEIYPNGTYGEQLNSVQAVTMGTLDVFNHSFSSDYYEPAGALQGPYLFRDYDHWHKFIGSDVYKEIVAGLEKAMNSKIISSYHYGFREVVFTDKAASPQEFSGKNMRVVNFAPYPEAATVLNTTGVPLGINDVYMAIKTGVVKGTENPLQQIRVNNFQEVTKYLILTDHMLAIGTWIMSDKKYNSLSDGDKKLVEEAFWVASKTIEQGYEAAEKECVDQFKAAGLEVVTPNKTLFMERLPLVFKKYPQWEEIYKRVQAIK